MDYVGILTILCLSLLIIGYKYIHYALLKLAVYKKQYEIAIFMRFFSRFVDIINLWGYYFFFLIILSLILKDLGITFLGVGFLLFVISLLPISYHLIRAIISITNYHYHFSKYILYLRSFKDDLSTNDRKYITSIQQYTNMKLLGIGDPTILHHDTSFTDYMLKDNTDLFMLWRTERTWKNCITKLMRKSQFILIKVDSTDGVMYEINYALTHHRNKVIFLIEEKEDYDFFHKHFNYSLNEFENCNFPALACEADGKIKFFSIHNIGFTLQNCFNYMSKSIPSYLYNINAKNLYWKAWDIYHSSRFEAPAYEHRRKKTCILLWKSYCNGYEKAEELLKTILTKNPELKNTWSEKLFL